MDVINLIATYGVGIIAALAFLVNVVVEVTKNIGFLKKIPTDVYVTFISVLLTVASYFVIVGATNRGIIFYEFILAFFASYIVAFIAIFGWTKLKELWERFKK